MAKESAYDKADKKLQRASKTIGAIVALIAAATGICTWVSNQFQSIVSAQIADLSAEMQESDRKTEVQITRLELMTLIDTQPGNVAEIEKVARHYFYDLGADWYLTSVYSSWAKEYGGDIDIILGVD